MYCRKCGKFFYAEGDLCKECAATAEPFGEETVVNAQEAEPKQTYQAFYSDYVAKNRGFSTARTGFIFAIITFVLSVISLSIVYFNYIMIVGGLTEGISMDYVAMLTGGITGGLIFGLASVGIAIPAIICGIKSIIAFVRAAKEGGAKPVKTLVFGIISAVFGVSGIIEFLYSLILILDMANALSMLI